jgi:hypothetical protein
MNEVFLLLLGGAGVFAAGGSIALLALGKMIDEFPAGDESKRTRGIASPVETTKIATALFWIFFVIGGWAVLQEKVYVMVAGITTLFAICLFMMTALVFSFAVLNTMRGRTKGIKTPVGIPVLQLSSAGTTVPVAVPPTGPVPQTPVLRKRYNNPVTDFMLNALLKKE